MSIKQKIFWIKRYWTSVVVFATVMFFVACGEQETTENITQINQMNMEVVLSVKELPKCTRDNEGELAWVKGEPSVRICSDGKWFQTAEKDSLVNTVDTVYLKGEDLSCSTKELKDKSGLKIICNGDSVGVVLNGAKGDDGQKGEPGEPGKAGADGKNGNPGNDGVGCSITSQTDSSVTIKCGDSSLVLNLGNAAGVSFDTSVVDSEKIAISLDSLAGYSQKGPFLKGSTVYLYELSDGRTLKQTNGNFTSVIKNDDGRYKFTSRNLVSQYALLVAEGKYRNEVTGKPTNTAIKLHAYTNMLSRRSANVNLLTHLETDRVYYLVTKEKKTVRAAKKQAQAEILSAFHIDASNFKTESEDLDVFGNTDADGALLAVSAMLQGDGDETDLLVLLTEIAGDMEMDGSWDDSVAKAKITDWAMKADLTSRLKKIRENVASWGLGKTVPNFEKFVHNYWKTEYKVGKCGKSKDGDTLVIPNEQSFAQSLKCKDGEWIINKMRDTRDGHIYRVTKIGEQTWMAENLNYADSVTYKSMAGRSSCLDYRSGCVDWADYMDEDCSKYGRYYTWSAAMDSAGIFSDNGKGCGRDSECRPDYPVQGICPNGWHLPDSTEWRVLFNVIGDDASAWQAKGYPEWPNATDEYGFSAIPMGYDVFGGGCLRDVGKNAQFQSASLKYNHTGPYALYIYGTSSSYSYVKIDNYSVTSGFAVRCLLD